MSKWQVFALGASEVIGLPIEGADGRMWFSNCFQPVSSGFTQVWAVDTMGAKTSYTIHATIGGQATRQLITDGTDVYTRFDSLFPHEYLASVTTGGAVTSNIVAGPVTMYGQVNAGGTCVVVGRDGLGRAAAASCTLAAVFGQSVGYAGLAHLSDIIFDGSDVWCPTNLASIMSIDPASLTTHTTYALPDVPSGGQMGYDGTYAYIGCSTGIMVYPLGGSGSVYTSPGSVQINHVYYSGNLDSLGLLPIVMAANDGNIYLMAAGGASSSGWKNIGSVGGIVTPGVDIVGFGDGPNMKLWATVTNPVPKAWCILYPFKSAGIVHMP